MKSLKKIVFAAVFFTAFALHMNGLARPTAGKEPMLGSQVAKVSQPVVNVDQVLTTERNKIQQLTIDTEKIKAAATIIINETPKRVNQKEISQLEAAKIIGEQHYIIKQAEQRLAQVIKQSVEEVKEAEAQEQGYMSRFISGVKDVGARFLAKVGYGSTEQEKGIAESIIMELNKQLEEMKTEYAEKIKNATSAEEKDRLTFEYDKIKTEFENEIYEQKLITGEESNVNKKLYWSAVGTAAAVVGGVLLKQYLDKDMPDAQFFEKQLQEERTAKTAREREFEKMEEAYKFPPLRFGLTPKEQRLISDVKASVKKTASAIDAIPLSETTVQRSKEPEFGFPQEMRGMEEEPKFYGASGESYWEKSEQYLEPEERPFGGIETYGATEPGKSNVERLKKWSDESVASPEALERKKQATNVLEKQAAQQAEWRKELETKRRTYEEQKKLINEIGEDISTRAQSAAQTVGAAGQSAGRRAVGAYQFSVKEPMNLTSEEIQERAQREQELRSRGQQAGQFISQEIEKRAPAIDEFGERLAEQQWQSEGDIETYGAGPDEESGIERVPGYLRSFGESAREAATNPKYINPEEGGI